MIWFPIIQEFRWSREHGLIAVNKATKVAKDKATKAAKDNPQNLKPVEITHSLQKIMKDEKVIGVQEELLKGY